MDSLLPIINELQMIFKNTSMKEIELPQIVVVGAQSSGKSSVLESLVRKSFLPRGSGIVTRCPTILQLHHLTEEDGEEYFELLQRDSEDGNEYSTTFGFDECQKLQEAIEDMTNEIAGTNKGIVDTPIFVSVYSQSVVPLTVVDLPGVVKVAIGDQPEDIEEQVMKMIRRYIKNENALILAVCPGNADMATSESIKIAREVDPSGDRTLAVITKLDLLGKGESKLKELNGEVIPVKLGIVGVINRSQDDLNNNKSVEQAMADELKKLNEAYPQLNGRLGSDYLANKLSSLLLEHIKKCIPALKMRIHEISEAKAKRREQLGTELPTSTYEKITVLYKNILDFEDIFKKHVQKRSDFESSGSDENDDASVGSKIADATSTFTSDIESIYPLEEYNERDILQLMFKTTSFEGFISIEDVFKKLVKDEILRLKQPCKKYAELFHEILLNTINVSLEHCHRFPKLKTAISLEMKTILDEMLLRVKTEILEELFEEKLIMIHSNSKKFNRLLASSKESNECGRYSDYEASLQSKTEKFAFPLCNEPKNTSSKELQYIKQIVVAYVLSVRKQLTNAWPGKAMHKLFSCVMKNFSASVAKLCEKFDLLIVEPSRISMERKQNDEDLKMLEQASSVLNKIQDTHFDAE